MVITSAVRRTSVDRLPAIKARLLRSINPKIYLENNTAVMHLPGFKYDDFDRAGHLNIVKLNRMSEMNRLSGHGLFDHLTGFYSNMFARHNKYLPALYSRAAVEFPMRVQNCITGLGTSSIDLRQTFCEEVTGDLLASFVFRIINVDPETQTSRSISDEMREVLSKRVVTGTVETFPPIKPPAAIPDKSFSCDVVVRHEDMDFLFHTTQGVYLGFARECAAQAAHAGFYSCLKDDIAFYRASESTAIHLGESFAGDKLKVSTWEDPSCALLLHFAVTKDTRMIYYATIRYFDDK